LFSRIDSYADDFDIGLTQQFVDAGISLLDSVFVGGTLCLLPIPIRADDLNPAFL
jgi:hypothetical protein